MKKRYRPWLAPALFIGLYLLGVVAVGLYLRDKPMPTGPSPHDWRY